MSEETLKPEYSLTPPKYLCPKHGEITGIIPFYGPNLVEHEGTILCIKCYAELLIRECCKVELVK